MPSCSKAKNPQGVKIVFTEADHSYKSSLAGREISYVSGTTFLGKFFKPFDPTGVITARCAKKEGVTVEELKARWAEKSRQSCIFGTKVHSICEDILNNRAIREQSPQTEKEEKTFQIAKNVATIIKAKLNILGVEKIVFNHKLPTPIAGTIDVLAQSKIDGSYVILDWKTSNTINIENPYNNFCLDPISHIPDNNYYHYSLQTSLYQFLLVFGKYVPYNAKFKRVIVHLFETGYKIYKLPDLINEIKDIIIYNASNFN